MKNTIVPAFAAFLVCANAFSQAVTSSIPRVVLRDNSQAQEDPFGTLLPIDGEKALYTDLKTRMEAAVDSGDPASIAALYQTNDVTADELKSELARWRRVLGDGAKPVSQIFKVLHELPPESNAFWTWQAQRATRHYVTHILFLHFTDGAQLMLPAVCEPGKLFFVTSEKLTTKRIEPGHPANGSQPSGPQTNQPSHPAGSRR